LDLTQLKQLEKFYYKALDKTKGIKFVQKYSQDKTPTADFSVNTEDLWKQLKIDSEPLAADSESEESSLEFESSFYKSKKVAETSVELNDSSFTQ
jgi:hypothetical protein